jgi:hypothetical protein
VLDDVLVVGRAAGELAGLGDQGAGGGELGLAAAHGFGDEAGRVRSRWTRSAGSPARMSLLLAASPPFGFFPLTRATPVLPRGVPGRAATRRLRNINVGSTKPFPEPAAGGPLDQAHQLDPRPYGVADG